ncbi:MAG: GNAT family N-acetyltransferase [Verrucomicrobia bacterium]|nr:GNAT family N-acetyltransferase [Verrucomicrobiota bacterium]MBV8377033.1 GNAT family N-acetyltransferase [Verrucomicrobiota bacterium]
MVIRPPATEPEFEAYYAFRWKILRHPWQQPPGSEKDDCEEEAIHLAAWDDTGRLIGVGRLHRVRGNVGQVRYMAVDPGQRSLGVGKAILKELEFRALQTGIQEIKLNSRQDAVQFYQKNGYQLLRPSDTLFGTIPHFEMWKRLR